MFLKTFISPVLILSVSGLFLVSSCGETQTKTNAAPAGDSLPIKAIVDTADFAVLPSDSTTHLISGFPKDLKAAELTSTDLRLMDSLMKEIASTYNSDLLKKKESKSVDSSISAIDLNAYKKQYIAIINAKGEKEVWANCFCKAIEQRIEFVDWKKIPVKVIDGGNCFFNVKLNLARRKAYDFTVNSGG